MNIFFRRKDKDFLLIAALVSAHISFLLLVTTSVLAWTQQSLLFDSSEQPSEFVLSSSMLVWLLKKLAVSDSAPSVDPPCLCNKMLSSFCSFPTSSGVSSWGRFWEKWLCLNSSFMDLFPNVPIASNSLGQSMNSSLRDSCRMWSMQGAEVTLIII